MRRAGLPAVVRRDGHLQERQRPAQRTLGHAFGQHPGGDGRAVSHTRPPSRGDQRAIPRAVDRAGDGGRSQR